MNRDIINIGPSNNNVKTIDIDMKYTDHVYLVNKANWASSDTYNDQFKITISSGKAVCQRLDSTSGWGMNLAIYAECISRNARRLGIPKIIHITVADKSILNNKTNKVTKAIESIQSIGKGLNFQVIIYDDDEARNIVEQFGDKLLLTCYDEMLPGAYRADIFRLVILYIHGGIYLDAGVTLQSHERLLQLIENYSLVLCKERPGYEVNHGIYSVLMCSAKEHPFIKLAIDTIKEHVRRFDYGKNDLYVTGPGILGNAFRQYYKDVCKLGPNKDPSADYSAYILYNNNLEVTDLYGGLNIKITHSKARDNYGKNQLPHNYGHMWRSKKVFSHLTYGNWFHSAKDYYIDEDCFLVAKLKTINGSWVDAKIKIERNQALTNRNGVFVATK